MVTVKANGKMEVLSCVLSDELMALNDREMVEDLIRAATNQALERVRKLVGEETRNMASGLGIPVNRVFLVTFAAGSGLAGLGGALGAEVFGLDPGFPLKYMIYFLIVVAVGGTSTITGPLLAALLLGIADVFGKYYAPKLGAFIVYTLMIVILLWRPQGLFVRRGAR